MTFLIFVFILGLLIVVHEAGHFFMARRVGVRVEEFAFGFGPKLLAWKRGDTEYRLCAIPLGGYVKLAGDERASLKGGVDEFFSKAPGLRALIILAGPVVNFILAYFCFVLVFMIGAVDLDASSRMIQARVGKVIPGSAAEQAGIVQDDLILRINGEHIPDWGKMQDAILASKDGALTLVVERGEKQIQILVTPKLEKTRDIFGREHRVPRIGIAPHQVDQASALVVKRYGFLDSCRKGAGELWTISVKTYAALWEIITGQRSAKEGMTGLIGIFFVIKFAVGVGFSFLLHIVGVISASLALFNILPLIPLDGGHLALIGLEKIRGRGLSVRTEELIAKAGLGLIITLAVFVFYLDFERIGLIDKITGFFK